MSTSEELLRLITKALDRRKREIDGDLSLKQVKFVLRRITKGWIVQVERLSEDGPKVGIPPSV